MKSADPKGKIKWLFPTPLHSFDHPDPLALNDRLWRDACVLRRRQQGIHHSNVNGWHSSYDLFDRPEESFKEIKGWMLECSAQASREIKEDFLGHFSRVSIYGWININCKGSYNKPHSHPNSHWSGVYYVANSKVKADAMSGGIEFLDPRGLATTQSSLPKTECFMDRAYVQPRPGLLLLFPSYLSHWVYPNESESERMSIAFNIRYKR